jgi:hypothetical protein
MTWFATCSRPWIVADSREIGPSIPLEVPYLGWMARTRRPDVEIASSAPTYVCQGPTEGAGTVRYWEDDISMAEHHVNAGGIS